MPGAAIGRAHFFSTMPISSRPAGQTIRRSANGAHKLNGHPARHTGSGPEPHCPAPAPSEREPQKPGTVISAAGEEVQIPAIEGDGVAEIQNMRGPVIRANIAKALEGSYLHMRALFEYAGLWPAAPAADAAEASLAALLLERLELESRQAQAASGDADFDNGTAARTNGSAQI